MIPLHPVVSILPTATESCCCLMPESINFCTNCLFSFTSEPKTADFVTTMQHQHGTDIQHAACNNRSGETCDYRCMCINRSRGDVITDAWASIREERI
jgi:hypothetical protein